MSEKERESFFRGAVSRAAGKRQIKPSNAFLDGELHHLTESFGDEEDDEDFTERDQSDASSLSSEEEEDEELEDEDESKTGYESGSESEEDEVDDESKDNKDIPSTSSAVHQKTTHPKQRINGIINIDDDDQMDTNFESQKICSICLDLNKHSDHLGELIQCDKCGIRVHESCYGIGGEEQTTSSEVAQSMSSSASTEPWFCEPCLLGNGIRPHCELCPSRFGAFKRTDIQGCWAHLICALFTPEITFTEPDHLSGINWDDIDRNFGRKPCAGCTDRLESRVGITVKCDAGLCKNYFHVTCAQRLGLLIENPNYHRSSLNHEAGYLYCKIHNHNEDLIHKQKSAYKKFIKQENERMVEFKRINLDDRQEKKWRRQLDERLKQIELANAATSSSTNDSPLQKKAKFLHTRAKYLNGFAEKAEELLGMSRKQFEDEFWNIPASQLTIGLPPTLSKAFVGYVEYRESTLFGEEEEKLGRNKRHRDELLENQKGIAEELKNVRMERDELAQKSENQNELYEKLKTAIRSIVPTSIIEKTTTTPNKKKIDRKRSLPKMQNTTTKTTTGIDEKRAKKMEMNDIKLSPSLFTKFGSNNDNKQPSKIAATLTKTQAMGKGLTNETSFSPPPTLMSACNSKSISPDGPSQGPLECNKCKKCNDLHLLIFCETCKFNYHIGCLDPPLERMPTKNKFSRFECSDCAEENEPGPDEMEPKAKDKQLPNDWKLSAMRTRRRTLL